MAKVNLVCCFSGTVYVAEKIDDAAQVTKLTMQPNNREVQKTIVVNLSSSIATMAFDSFNLKVNPDGQAVTEGIILLDNKGTLHSLSCE